MKKFKQFSLTTFLLLCIANISAAESNRGLLAWSAFECSYFSSVSGKPEEAERLFMLGYETSQSLLKDIENEKISDKERKKIPIGITMNIPGPSIDFIVGRIYSAAMTTANISVVKTDSDILRILDPMHSATGSLKELKAENQYQSSNCALLGI